MNGDEQLPSEPAPDEQAQPAEETVEPVDLREELDEALREKVQFRSMAQRAQADLVNYRRRAADESEERRRDALSQLLLKLLSVVDGLERGISIIPQDAVAPGWLDGLLLVLRNVNSILDSEGVSRIEARGKSFDPWESEAVQQVETADAEEGTVIEVIQNGYKHYDKVLRAAQVVVAKKPEPAAQAEMTEEETDDGKDSGN